MSKEPVSKLRVNRVGSACCASAPTLWAASSFGANATPSRSGQTRQAATGSFEIGSKGTLEAALDLSSPEFCFAVADGNGRICCEKHEPLRGRDAAGILPWLENALAESGHELSEIGYWTMGTGPGSFTGLRIVAALLMGLHYGRPELRVRGIPSALALASGTDSAGGRVGVLFDGRRGEVICCEVRKSGGVAELSAEPLIFGSDVAEERVQAYDYLVALAAHRDVLRQSIGSFADKVYYHDVFPVRELLADFSGIWDSSSLRDLVYARPAVYAVSGKVNKTAGER